MAIPPIGLTPAISNAVPLALAPAGVGSASDTAPGGSGGFGSLLTSVLSQLNAIEKNATDIVERAAAGENVDIHDVMIATQTESLAFNTAVTVRNKLVEAYQQVMQMQM